MSVTFNVYWKKIDGIIKIQLPMWVGVYVAFIPEDELNKDHKEFRHLISGLPIDDYHIDGGCRKSLIEGIIHSIENEDERTIGIPSGTQYGQYWFEIHPNKLKGEDEFLEDKCPSPKP